MLQKATTVLLVQMCLSSVHHICPHASILPSAECCERRGLKRGCRWRVLLTELGTWGWVGGGGVFPSCSTLLVMEKGSCCCAAHVRVSASNWRTTLWDLSRQHCGACSRPLHTHTQTRRAGKKSVSPLLSAEATARSGQFKPSTREAAAASTRGRRWWASATGRTWRAGESVGKGSTGREMMKHASTHTQNLHW